MYLTEIELKMLVPKHLHVMYQNSKNILTILHFKEIVQNMPEIDGLMLI